MKIIKASNKPLLICVDEQDYDLVSKSSWYINEWGYAIARIKIKKGHYENFLLHRLILGLKKGVGTVDHINREKLDCRRVNLRMVTESQSQMNRPIFRNNTTGYKGVYFDKERNKFTGYAGPKGNRKRIGRFDTAEEAAIAYNKRVKELYGEYAFQNEVSK